VSAASLEKDIAALTSLSSAQLRARWLQLYKCPAPALTADLLRRGVAWKMQEKARGGHAAAVLRELNRLARSNPDVPMAEVRSPARIKAGTRLVRHWGGQSHHIIVLDRGFLYQDQQYRSLSHIARTITGAQWSGPRFFGLTAVKETRADA
jgi:hypothetical protein